MSTETIDQYLKDPLSMPEGLAGIEALMAGETGETLPDPLGTETNSEIDGATLGTDGQGKEVAQAGNEQEPENSVVKSKDGKHEIPYTVLQQERENRVRAERMAQELTEKLALVQHAKETGQPISTRALDDIVDEDTLAELREESPMVADTIDKLIATIRTQGEQLARVTPMADQSERESEIQRQVTVEEAIAAVPKLTHLRTNDTAAFNEVAAFDEMLRGQAKWNGKPMQDRFEAAVRMYEAANGAVDVPGATPPAQPVNAAKRVEDAVKKAHASARGPNTLSDIPGGGLPATDEQASVEEMSASALTQKMFDMTEDQRDAFLARIT